MTFDGVEESALVDTTMGQIIFNTPIPQDLGYVDRTDPEHKFDYEMNPRTLKIASGGKSDKLTKKGLPDIISRCLTKHGTKACAIMLDAIKAQGYKYSTLSAITVAVPDAIIPEEKPAILAACRQEDRKGHEELQPRSYFGRGALPQHRCYLAGGGPSRSPRRLGNNLRQNHQAQPHLYDCPIPVPVVLWTRSNSWPACAACWPTRPVRRWKCPFAPTTVKV